MCGGGAELPDGRERAVALEQDVPIVVVSDPELAELARLWPSLKDFS